MPRFELRLVDAFTREPLLGNAAAVLPDASGLDDRTMQAIAREMNQSETAFLFRIGVDRFRVRYFTPVSEIPLAGHPTVASAHVLRESGRIGPDTRNLIFEMPAGAIPIEIEPREDGERYTMTQPAPQFLRTYDRCAIAAILALSESDLVPDVPVQTVSTGTPQLMVPLISRDALARVRPDARQLFAGGIDYFSVHVFARDHGAFAFRARHFAPLGDVAEDPVTGSASGGMGAYAVRYGLIERRKFTATQGEHVGRPGTVEIEVLGADRTALEGVRVGGDAVTVFIGELHLP